VHSIWKKMDNCLCVSFFFRIFAEEKLNQQNLYAYE